MEKPVAAIELSSRQIKVVIGYVIDGDVQIIYTMSKPIGHLVDAGSIPQDNLATLIAKIKQSCSIEDSGAKLKINISDAVIALPPYGLEVFQTKQETTVVTEDSTVTFQDVKNAYTMVRKCKLPVGNELVDILPTQFILEHGAVYSVPPINQKSSTLTVCAKIHSLPSHIAHSYTNAFRDAGISIKRKIVSPQGAIEIISSFDKHPSDYVLVDIGSDITTVSLVGGKKLYSSRFFNWGGENINSQLKETLQVNSDDAEKFKILYGYDTRELSFDPEICSYENEEGKEIKHTLSEFNACISKELDIFISHLNAALDSLFASYDDPKYKTMPMLLIGGGSSLLGLKEYMNGKVPSKSINLVTPKTLGARNPSLFNCLGMILINSKYPNAYDDNQSKIDSLGRNPKREGN